MSGRGSNRREQPGGWGDSAALWSLIGLVVAVVGVIYTAVHVGHRLAGDTSSRPPSDPFETLFGLLDGSVAWPAQATYVATTILLTVAALGAVAWRAIAGRRRRKSRLDWTATYLGRGKEIDGISAGEARRKAESWGMSTVPAKTGSRASGAGSAGSAGSAVGIGLGRALAGGQRLYASFEDVLVLVAGPRTGKTLCYAIPALLDAPGAVLVTSNKRDLVDATRDVRAAYATPRSGEPAGKRVGRCGSSTHRASPARSPTTGGGTRCRT